MGKRLLTWVIMLLIMTSCTSPQNEFIESEKNNGFKRGLEAIPDDSVISDVEVGSEENDDKVAGDLPISLMGSTEDKKLRITIQAKLEEEKMKYKTNIRFTNKSEGSLDLIYDCGLLISIEDDFENSGDCPAVESMLLKRKSNETLTVMLASDYFNGDNNLLYIRYRQDKEFKVLRLKLQNADE